MLIAAAVGLYLAKSKINLGEGSSSSVTLREAPRGLTAIKVETTSPISEGRVDLATETALLTDVKYQGEAQGTADRSYGGGVYILSVNATLPDPKGHVYGVWLVGDSGPVLVDYMSGSKTSWSLRLRGPDKYSQYGGIWITLERAKDEIPEEHILEGSF